MIYQFECKVCETAREFNMGMDDACRVGESREVTDSVAPDQETACECGANNWTRVWPRKTSGFRFNFRRTPLV